MPTSFRSFLAFRHKIFAQFFEPLFFGGGGAIEGPQKGLTGSKGLATCYLAKESNDALSVLSGTDFLLVSLLVLEEREVEPYNPTLSHITQDNEMDSKTMLLLASFPSSLRGSAYTRACAIENSDQDEKLPATCEDDDATMVLHADRLWQHGKSY